MSKTCVGNIEKGLINLQKAPFSDYKEIDYVIGEIGYCMTGVEIHCNFSIIKKSAIFYENCCEIAPDTDKKSIRNQGN